MAEYVDLNKTEVLTEASEAANMVVEENGKLKRVPVTADALPTVLTPIRTILDKKANDADVVKAVNGVEPDENGNVTFDALPEGAAANQQLVTDEAGAAKWEARTHYVAPDGTVHPLDPKFIPESIARTQDVNNAISALGNVLRFKGAVATVDLLPTEGNALGDVYYVTEGSSGYVWMQDADGVERWEQLGPMISGEFLPTGATAHQVLVTDGDGKAKWEDKVFYEESVAFGGDTYTHTYLDKTFYPLYISKRTEYEPSTNDKMHIRIQGEYIMRGTTYSIEIDTTVAFEENLLLKINETEEFVLNYMGGTTANPESKRFFLSIRNINTIANKPTAATYYIKITCSKTVPLPSSYLPTTVPVIPTAQVGQTVVVKAVDDQGKPTEWEAVEAASGGLWTKVDTLDRETAIQCAKEGKPVYWEGNIQGVSAGNMPTGFSMARAGILDLSREYQLSYDQYCGNGYQLSVMGFSSSETFYITEDEAKEIYAAWQVLAGV